MANEERQAMLGYGQWLEGFLNCDLSGRSLKKLAREAIRMLNVEYASEAPLASSVPLESLRRLLAAMLNLVLNTDEPWQDVLAAIENSPPPENPLDFNDAPSQEASMAMDSFNYFVSAYGGLIDTYEIREGCMRKVRKFDPVYLGSDSGFPWFVVVSRIFLDFLAYGGQDYIGICPRCGKFFAAERKGRKIFCSSYCATMQCIESRNHTS